MEIRKVYDELYGMIEDLKRKISGIQPGDTVTITPALESGTKVADYSIGETTGSLYAPTPFIPKDYSTTEQDTGLKWIDGTAIYQKTIDFGALPNTTAKQVAHDISNLGTVVKIEAIGGNSTDGYFSLPMVSGVSFAGQSTIWITPTNIEIASGADRSGYNAYVTVFYTKTSPENNTKNRRKK